MEVLVVLIILTMAVSVFATVRPGPSAAMQREAIVTQLIADAVQMRTNAIRQSRQMTMLLPEPFCADSPTTLTFFPSGTALETQICLIRDVTEIQLYLDPLTAQLRRIDGA